MINQHRCSQIIGVINQWKTFTNFTNAVNQATSSSTVTELVYSLLNKSVFISWYVASNYNFRSAFLKSLKKYLYLRARSHCKVQTCFITELEISLWYNIAKVIMWKVIKVMMRKMLVKKLFSKKEKEKSNINLLLFIIIFFANYFCFLLYFYSFKKRKMIKSKLGVMI